MVRPATNALKEKLKAGHPTIGVVCPGYWPELVEICGYLGYDWVQIDFEHSALTLSQAAELVRAAEVAGITPVGRVALNASHHIGRILDIGMRGVVVPHLSSRADAEAAVHAAYFHPYGDRGFGSARASGFWTRYSMQEFVAYTNDETVIAVIIEDATGVANLDEILSVPKIDVVSIGHVDLSHSLGMPGDISNPVVQANMATAIKKIRRAGLVLGLGATDGEGARRRIEEQGAGWVIVQLTQLFANGARAFLAGAARPSAAR